MYVRTHHRAGSREDMGGRGEGDARTYNSGYASDQLVEGASVGTARENSRSLRDDGRGRT